MQILYPNLDKPKPNSRMLSRNFIYPGFGLSRLASKLPSHSNFYIFWQKLEWEGTNKYNEKLSEFILCNENIYFCGVCY